jgi:hydroxymethylglutaryl-CoA reductase
LRALATEGIQRGHMTLHARNIALGAGATGGDVDWLVQKMITSMDFRTDFAKEVLNGPRDA